MRSAIHESFGEPADVLTLAECDKPQPAGNQIRVKMTLAPIHNHDLWTVRGNYGYKPELPAIGGSEAVGIIDAIGADVQGLKVGQRVAVAGAHGTWAEYFVGPAKAAVPMPDELDDEIAAQLIAMPLSALMLLEFLAVDSGQWVIQNAANGAVGKTLAMLAAARGVNVINVVRRDEAIDELQQLGIKHIVSTANDDWQQQVKDILGDDPLTAAVDSVGGRESGELLNLLGENGTLVSFGSMTGEPMTLSSGDVIFKQAVVKGFWGSKVSQNTSAEDKKRLIGELIQQATQGKLQLPVEAIYGLDEAAKAAKHALQKGRQGKVLLKA